YYRVLEESIGSYSAFRTRREKKILTRKDVALLRGIISNERKNSQKIRKNSLKKFHNFFVGFLRNLAIWEFGHLEIWPFGNLAIWPFGLLDFWQFGLLAIWLFGHLAIWKFDNWP